MSVETTTDRDDVPLDHFIMTCGQIGRLQTISRVPVVAGDLIEAHSNLNVSLSPLRQPISMDAHIDVFTFYIPHRHIYGEEWIDFVLDGVESSPLSQFDTISNRAQATFMARNNGVDVQTGGTLPKWMWQGYQNIYNNFFKIPYLDDLPTSLEAFVADADAALYGAKCAHLKDFWTCPVPPNTSARDTLAIPVDDARAVLDLAGLNSAFGELHTEQERDVFMQRYRDVIKSFKGHTAYDGDLRPHLMMRSQYWMSGYDVNGTDQTSLGSASGRVSQTLEHKIPKFFVPEHGAIWTVALVRFPPVHAKFNHYLDLKSQPSYLDLMCDAALVNNTPPVELRADEIFSTDVNPDYILGRFAHSQWYRTHPDTIHYNFGLGAGFPFLQGVPTPTNNQLYVESSQYTPMFASNQLGHWNIQGKCNMVASRYIPSARDSIMTNDG